MQNNNIFDPWLSELSAHNLTPIDLERMKVYARDLVGGLNMVRQFPQGVTVYGSARFHENHKYYKAARQLGKMLAEGGHTVTTGGGPGIMEAANRGAFEVGGRSVGLNVTLEHEQHPNPYLTECFEFHYFFSRRVMLSLAGKMYVFFPGGYGTLDELSEIILLIKERKMAQVPVFLYGKSYWRLLDTFFGKRMLMDGTINPKDRSIYTITNDLDLIVRTANQLHSPNNANVFDNPDQSQFFSGK